jgi:hypothetical protein
MRASFALPGGAADWGSVGARLPAHLALDFRGAAVEVAATSEAAIATLRRVYRHFVVEGGVGAGPSPDRLVLLEAGTAEAASLAGRLGRDPHTLDGHLLLASWLGWGLRIEGSGLLHYYTSKLLRLRVAERWDAVIATLHAASLRAPTGGGLLLIGEAAAGKTTLTLRLIEDGFRYCADDTSCIRRSDLACIPFPMAFIVRGDRVTGVPREPALRGRPPDLALLDEPRWLLERWDAVGVPFRPDALYFVGPQPGDAAEVLRPLRPADAALLLLRNLVMPLGADAEAFSTAWPNFDLACRLAEACRCLTVDTSDLDRAHRAILSDYRAGAEPLQRVAV